MPDVMARRSLLLALATSGLAAGGLAACGEGRQMRPAGGVPPTSSPARSSPPGGASADGADGAPVALAVAKSPTCDCCTVWMEQLRGQGFSFTAEHPPSMPQMFADHGIRPEHQSCHLARSADGRLFVGHVAAPLIHAYLASPPAGSIGLAVPGMPVGSPGMESGTEFEPYAVLLLAADGSTNVFRQVTSAADQLRV